MLAMIFAATVTLGLSSCGRSEPVAAVKPAPFPAASRTESPVQVDLPPLPPRPDKFTISITPRGPDPQIVDVWADTPDLTYWPQVAPRLGERAAIWMLQFGRATDEGCGMIALPGDLSVIDGRLRFQPTLPLQDGVKYRAVFAPEEFLGRGGIVSRPSVDYTILPPKGLPAEVTRIYPSGDALPANHLKFYVFFSTPMEQGDTWNHFELIDETAGEPVPDPFRPTELWSEDGLRLTLWFHPGRQKTGVNLNIDIGPVLEAGHRYTLVVRKGWRAQNGTLLKDDVRKSFLATEAEHAQVDPQSWTMVVPVTGSEVPLQLKFSKPLDWSLLRRELHVEDSTGKKVDGAIGIYSHEKLWEFKPEYAWKPGRYELVVGGVLEDLAGNSVARPFEVDITQKPKGPPIKQVRLKFEILDGK